MTVDLVAFLKDALDEDEVVAQQIVDRDAWHGIHVDSATVVATHINRWDPARVLAEVAAKRAILDEHSPVEVHGLWDRLPDRCQICLDDGGRQVWPCVTARALVQPYAGRAGFDPSWLD